MMMIKYPNCGHHAMIVTEDFSLTDKEEDIDDDCDGNCDKCDEQCFVEEPDDLEIGFNPYMGEYDYDC